MAYWVPSDHRNPLKVVNMKIIRPTYSIEKCTWWIEETGKGILEGHLENTSSSLELGT